MKYFYLTTDGMLIDTTTTGQSQPESNVNEGLTPHSWKLQD